jgi:hypothetical protein
MKLLLAAALLATSLPAAAIGRIQVRASQVEFAGISVAQVDAQLLISLSNHSTLQVRTGRIRLPAAMLATAQAQAGSLRGASITCIDPQVREPLFACPRLSMEVLTEKLAPLRLDAQARFDSQRGALTASGTAPKVAGVSPEFTLAWTPAAWTAEAAFPPLSVPAWRNFLKPWAAVPDSLEISGNTALGVRVEGDSRGTRASVDFALRDGAFQNADYTWLGEKLAFSVKLEAELAAEPLRFQVQASGSQGQALAGPVVVDLAANPLQFTARGTFTPQRVVIDAFRSLQQDLANVSGSAQLDLNPFSVASASVDAPDIRFPAAYAAFLQQSLATTAFSQLKTAGSASASLRIAANQPVAVVLDVKGLEFSDEAQGLAVAGVKAHLDWAAGAGAGPPSFLEWTSARGWGISGGQARVDFAVQDRDFRLLRPARLPFFDGALRIDNFIVHRIGAPDLAADFEALIEPISIGPIATALGWPAFGGTLSGRIPGLSYRNRELTLQGDIEAQVFDGRVVARNLRVSDPLGNLPRLHADMEARNLDLDLITRTFEFGGITGKLDVDLSNLETVGLSPLAFDLRIATPATDKSRHRISQRALQNLSNIGGGGGGVAAALQSGALRFFDDFGYARLGLNCRLRNDVCQMSGAGPAGQGFYIVKGAGLPRIDIIGNNARVAWLTFIGQAANALSNPGEINVR